MVSVPGRAFPCVPAALALCCLASSADAMHVRDLVDQGEFAKAHSRISAKLSTPALPDASRQELEFERERMRRIRLDFALTREQVRERLLRQIPDLDEDEFRAWDVAGLIERMDIDGQRFYFNRSASNLFRLSAEARARRKNQAAFAEGPMESSNPHHREVRDAVAASGRRYGAARTIRVTQWLAVNPGAVPAGETVRAWLPYPRALPGQQENIRLLSAEPAMPTLAPESALQRTAYLEQPARAGQPTRFSVTYEMSVFGQFNAIDPERVVEAVITPELAPFAGERSPHVVYTPALRAFSQRVVGKEKNPYRIARKLFAAVDAIPWAGAREYSTISNISDYALHAGHADCGQQTLLLMTLLRLNGIPARWQSGMVYSDGDYWNLHDWGWMYLAPYGWIPMDVTFGRLQDPDPQIADFYFGGLDAYRIAFNDDYSRALVPAKTHFRSETVDLQRGEVEWRGGNLYFDQWDYGFKAEVLATASTAAMTDTRQQATPTGRER